MEDRDNFGRGDRGDRENYKDKDSYKDRDGGSGGFKGRRRKPPADLTFDYKDVETLRNFLSEGSKLVPSRISRLNARQQRELTQAVKRARHLALLPSAPQHAEY
ncbi:MAG: 30S ribosomal protein S18 [Bdellovibrionota bacterium]